jgi:exodeoxyribonuclease V gamma subunit
MPLHLHSHVTLAALAEAAVKVLRAPAPGDDPFAPDVLVVGGRGVEQWLRVALVERLDIVTNLAVWSPSRFMQDLERQVTGRAPASVGALTLDILAAVARDPALLPPELRHLREADGASPAGREPHLASGLHAASGSLPASGSLTASGSPPASGLPAVSGLLAGWATRMARTFERYLLYRTALLRAWEAGAGASDWQARLWRATVAASGRMHPPATAHQATCDALATGVVPTLAPRWLLVHQGRLAPAHLALARALAVHHDVHLLVHTGTVAGVAQLTGPAESIEQALARRHPLAARLDRTRVEALAGLRGALDGAPVVHAPGAAATPPESAATAPDAPRTLLAAVRHLAQRDTRSAADPSDLGGLSEQADDSLRVLACHGALRQVEVAKDAILGALNDDDTLEPRDILVLTPDPSRFVPLLQAVFPLAVSPLAASPLAASPLADDLPAAAAAAAPPLPLHVQGRAPRALNAVADVLLQLLALAEERVTASRVLALLERGPVAEGAEIAPADTPLVRAWFQAAGVRWGTDGADPARADLGLTDEGTWARGLTRLLLGTTLLEETPGDAGAADPHLLGHAPVPGLEGERVLLAGRAARAVRQLLTLVQEARAPRSLAAWAAFVHHALDTLVRADGAWATSVTRVREVAESLRTLPSSPTVGGADGPLYRASALAALLEHRLEEVLGAPGRFGGVTVAPLTAGWVRPARVIVLLGLDDELFPQRGATPWFDRLADAPAPGDPDERGDQLQTVFDALCMARDRLLITYTGWNRAGTMRLPPSMAVSALQETVHTLVPHGEGETPHDSWRRHVERDVPLQPFSRRAFTEAVVPSFDALAARIAQQLSVASGTRAGGAAGRAAGGGTAAPAGHATSRPAPSHGTASSAPAFLVRTRDTLPLATLLRFLTSPAEEILARLGVRLRGDAAPLDDVLPLTMPRRAEAVAVTDMAHALLRHDTIAGHLERLRHRDALPPAVLGRVWAHHAAGKARHLAARADAAVQAQPRHAREVLRVPVGRTVLTGTLESRHGTTLLFLRDGRHDLSRALRAFVTLCAASIVDARLTHAAQVDADVTTMLARPANPEEVLANLVALYHDADRTVPPYAPRSSFAYVDAIAKAVAKAGPAAATERATHDAALEKAREAWAPDDPKRVGEGEEPANRLLHAESPLDDPAFGTLARGVFGPLLASVEGP